MIILDKILLKRWEELQLMNIKTDSEEYKNLLKAVKLTIGKITRWYRSSYAGITTYTIKPLAKILDSAYFLFMDSKDKELIETYEVCESAAFEVLVHGSADHRFFRGYALYEAAQTEENFSDILESDINAVIDSITGEYELFKLTNDLYKKESK